MNAVAIIGLVSLLATGPASTTTSVAPAAVTTCRAPMQLEAKDAEMQAALAKAISEAGLDSYLKRGKLAVSLVDLTDSEHAAYAGLNDDLMMYAASLPKIAVLLAVARAVDQGKMSWSDSLQRHLAAMILRSSNADASWAIDAVGLEAIAATVRDPSMCFYDDSYGGLWVGRAYRRGGATERDPVFGITHGATARQSTRFYALLDRGKLISARWSARMLALMAPPELHHKFVGALADRAGVQFLARKSGTWRTYHADSALIEHSGRRYALTALVDSRHGEQIVRAIARVADDLMLHRAKGHPLASLSQKAALATR